jgi:uncharacterized protein YjbI with pentapeptide repeats
MAERMDGGGRRAASTKFFGAEFLSNALSNFLAALVATALVAWGAVIILEARAEDRQRQTNFELTIGTTTDLDGWQAKDWQDYEGLSLAAKSLTRSRWADADLTSVRFPHSDLYKATFTDLTGDEPPIINGAKFIGANLREAKFAGTDLSGVQFQRTCLQETDFVGARIEGVPPDFTGARYLDQRWPDGYEIDERDDTQLVTPEGVVTVAPLVDAECPVSDSPSSPVSQG